MYYYLLEVQYLIVLYSVKGTLSQTRLKKKRFFLSAGASLLCFGCILAVFVMHLYYVLAEEADRSWSCQDPSGEPKMIWVTPALVRASHFCLTISGVPAMVNASISLSPTSSPTVLKSNLPSAALIFATLFKVKSVAGEEIRRRAGCNECGNDLC